MKKAVFIERDGILNEEIILAKGTRPPKTVQEFKLITGAKEYLRKLKMAGFTIIIISNQPGLSNSSLRREELDRMHHILSDYFRDIVDHVTFCPHTHEDSCHCRRPEAGLLTEAAQKMKLNLPYSFVISNKWQDAKAARSAHCISIQIKSSQNGKGVRHDHLVRDLDEAVKKVLALDKRGYSK